MKTIKLVFIFYILILLSSNAKALQVIRDAESENFISW